MEQFRPVSGSFIVANSGELSVDDSKRNDVSKDSCKYNHGVICGLHTNCECCGWNPTVAEERKQKTGRKKSEKNKE